MDTQRFLSPNYMSISMESKNPGYKNDHGPQEISHDYQVEILVTTSEIEDIA